MVNTCVTLLRRRLEIFWMYDVEVCKEKQDFSSKKIGQWKKDVENVKFIAVRCYY